jgi:hypothetical protein
MTPEERDMWFKVLTIASNAAVKKMKEDLRKPRRSVNGKSYPLKNSRLEKSIKAEIKVEPIPYFAIQMNDYGLFVDLGRRPGVGKVPIQALVDWIKRKKINKKTTGRNITDIELAYRIQNAIFRHGINPRPFINEAIVLAEAMVDGLIDTYTSDYLDYIWNNAEIGFDMTITE